VLEDGERQSKERSERLIACFLGLEKGTLAARRELSMES
tara:strand:+ start:77 stop:193 length:117 start_codon:yes stop_codon:yes gene_type:complete